MDLSFEGILFKLPHPFVPLLSCLKTEIITALVSLRAWDAGERGYMRKTLSGGNGQLVALTHPSTYGHVPIVPSFQLYTCITLSFLHAMILGHQSGHFGGLWIMTKMISCSVISPRYVGEERMSPSLGVQSQATDICHLIGHDSWDRMLLVS